MARNQKTVRRSKYRVYTRFYTNIVDAIIKNKGGNQPQLRNARGWAALKGVVEAGVLPIRELMAPINCSILAAEAQWERSDLPAIFVQQKDVTNMMSGKFTINKLPELLTPFKAFTLCLPADFSIKGIKPGGVLVATYPDEHNYADCLKQTLGKLKLGDDFIHPPQDVKNIMTLAYTAPDGGHCVASHHGENLVTILNSKNFTEFKSLVKPIKNMNWYDSELNDDEMELQYAIFKLVLSISVYTMAKENAIKEGFPPVKGFVLDRPFGEEVTSYSLMTSFQQHASPKEHYRSWHIRQLVHEKFYQGEYATLPPNTRFVFVDDAIVNGKSSPKYID